MLENLFQKAGRRPFLVLKRLRHALVQEVAIFMRLIVEFLFAFILTPVSEITKTIDKNIHILTLVGPLGGIYTINQIKVAANFLSSQRDMIY